MLNALCVHFISLLQHITSTTAPISTTGELKISKNLIIDQRTDDLQRIDKQIELKDRRKLIEQEKNAAKEALELMRQKEIEAEKYGFKILNYSGSTNVSNNLNKEYIQRGSLDARHTATLKLNEREKKKSDRYTASLSQDKQATLNIELLRLT